MIKIKKSFDLDSTITCGQIFRFEKKDNKYIIVIKDRVISLEENKDNIIIESNNEENLLNVVNDYFDLNRDYNSIMSNIIKKDSIIKDAIVYGNGLKMIHQDPFETIISYIISQNNRVSSITNSVNMIAKKYGKKVIFNNLEYYLFPNYEDLKSLTVNDYRQCKVGFRDKYLFNIVKSINENNLNLEKIINMDSAESLRYLMSFPGIGPKVASCILLFSYQKFDVYPVDTWVKKFMKNTYNIEGENNIKKYTQKIYGEYSGLAIQYMFNYERNKKSRQLK